MAPLLPASLFNNHEHQQERKVNVIFPERMIIDRCTELLAAQRNAHNAASKYGFNIESEPKAVIKDVFNVASISSEPDRKIAEPIGVANVDVPFDQILAAQRAVDEAFSAGSGNIDLLSIALGESKN